MQAWVFCLGGGFIPPRPHHALAQKALDCALGYPQNQPAPAVARAFCPEPNHARPVHEVPNNRGGIEAEPLPKGRRAVKGLVRLNVLVEFNTHKSSVPKAGRKVSIKPHQKPISTHMMDLWILMGAEA